MCIRKANIEKTWPCASIFAAPALQVTVLGKRLGQLYMFSPWHIQLVNELGNLDGSINGGVVLVGLCAYEDVPLPAQSAKAEHMLN